MSCGLPCRLKGQCIRITSQWPRSWRAPTHPDWLPSPASTCVRRIRNSTRDTEFRRGFALLEQVGGIKQMMKSQKQEEEDDDGEEEEEEDYEEEEKEDREEEQVVLEGKKPRRRCPKATNANIQLLSARSVSNSPPPTGCPFDSFCSVLLRLLLLCVLFIITITLVFFSFVFFFFFFSSSSSSSSSSFLFF